MMILSFIVSIIILIVLFWFIQNMITRLAKNQKILEEKFMGPEIIAPVARGQVAAAQPVIQYIAVPQHFA